MLAGWAGTLQLPGGTLRAGGEDTRPQHAKQRAFGLRAPDKANAVHE